MLGLHSVDEFLFDTRAGFCEHYASAFAVMMRMAGIPSRVVTGYMGGFYNELGDYLLVRQSDAHAWVEVWLQGRGWTTIDPTAAVSPSRVDRGSLGAVPEPRYWFDLPWIRETRNSVDIVQQRWNDWVIEYNAQRQTELLAPLGLSGLTPSGLVIALVAALALIGLVVVPLVLKIRGPTTKDPARKAWLLFLSRLERAGLKTSLSDGPLELAAAAGCHRPHRRLVRALPLLGGTTPGRRAATRGARIQAEKTGGCCKINGSFRGPLNRTTSTRYPTCAC